MSQVEQVIPEEEKTIPLVIFKFLEAFVKEGGSFAQDDLNAKLGNLVIDIKNIGTEDITKLSLPQQISHTPSLVDTNAWRSTRKIEVKHEKSQQRKLDVEHDKSRELMVTHIENLTKLKEEDGLAQNAKDVVEFLLEKSGMDKEKNDLTEYFDITFKDAKPQDKKDFHRVVDTICWAVEPFQHKGMIDIDNVKEQYESIADLVANGAKKLSHLTAPDIEKKIAALFNDLEFAEQRELLARIYPIMPNPEYEEYKDVQEDVNKNKPVRGALAKLNFILNSGKTDDESIKARQVWADKKMGAVFGLQSEFGTMQYRADLLLKALLEKHEDEGAHDCEIGPVKLLEGVMLKADRKYLGKDKESDYDWLPYLKKANDGKNWENSIVMDIKDIIRGTLIFKSFDEMMICLAKMTKTFVDPADETITKTHGVVGISKVANGFNSSKADDTSTYRDMKIVVNLKFFGKEHARHLKELLTNYDTKVDYVPFEIQLNTLSGITIKNAGTGLHNDFYYREGEDRGLQIKRLGEEYHVEKSHMFNSDKFVDDCFGVVGHPKSKDKPVKDAMHNLDVARFIKGEYHRKMEVLATDTPKDDCWSEVTKDVKAIKKAHGVYKMSGKRAIDKKKCEAVYNKIYEMGFWKDGYHPGYPNNKDLGYYEGTHCAQFKGAFSTLVKELNGLPKRIKEKQDKIDELGTSKEKEVTTKIEELNTDIVQLSKEAVDRLEKFLKIIESSAAPYSDKDKELEEFSNQSTGKSINIDERLRIVRERTSRAKGNKSFPNSSFRYQTGTVRRVNKSYRPSAGGYTKSPTNTSDSRPNVAIHNKPYKYEKKPCNGELTWC